jgi:uncharacterized UPF0146 family protein
VTRPRRAVADALAAALVEFAPDRAVEVGVGRRPDVAAALAERGRTVAATDITERPVPDGVRFVRDDVTDPDPTVYAGADLVYALNCPPELQRPLVDAATGAEATWAFTTLGADPAVVDASPRTLPGGTLFTAPARKVDP